MKNTNRVKRETQSVGETIYGYLRYTLDLLISIYMVLLLTLLPFYNTEGYSKIGTDKATFFRITLIYCGGMVLAGVVLVLLYKAFSGNGEHRKKLTVTDMFAAGYCICVVLSYFFTNYKEEALWGTRGWFMGMIPQLAAVGSYFVISRMWTKCKWMLPLVMGVSGIVFVLGYLNRFGIHPIDMKVQNVSFVSTIGNINWYCGYAMCVFFIGYVLLWAADLQKTWQKVLLMAYVTIGFATLLTHGSISGVVALGVIIVVTFCMSVSDGRRMEMFWLEMILLSATCGFTFLMCRLGVFKVTYKFEATILYTNVIPFLIMTIVSVAFYVWVLKSNSKGCYPKRAFNVMGKAVGIGAPALMVILVLVIAVNTATDGIIYRLTGMSENAILTFSPRWGSNRGATYLAGLYCFREQDILHKLTGVGPDCMATFLYSRGSEELVGLVKGVFGNSRLTNAHNEWLTILVNIGLPGCICYAGMVVSGILRFIRNRKKSVVALACGFCLLAYTINNMFSFQQTMGLATMFIIWGIGENYLREAEG